MTTLTIKDLPCAGEMAPAAMATVRGGYTNWATWDLYNPDEMPTGPGAIVNVARNPVLGDPPPH